MFDALYLSPHFDDAVLSCGAQIWDRAQRGEKVLVATVCAAPPPPLEGLSPFALSLHQRWGEPGEFDRAAEDRAAVTRLGATPWHMRFADCIYRRAPEGAPLYASEAAIFGALSPQEAGLVEQVAAAFRQFERELKPDGAIFAPYGLGNHVDHQLVRAAAELWGRNWRGLFQYYADYPYAESVPGGVAVRVSEAGRRRKLEAIRAYQSQLSSFWASEAEMAEKVSQWAERTF